MPSCSSKVGFALPISNSLYICLESTDIISPSSCLANSMDNLVFPDALGPVIAIIFCFVIVKTEYQKQIII